MTFEMPKPTEHHQRPRKLAGHLSRLESNSPSGRRTRGPFGRCAVGERVLCQTRSKSLTLPDTPG